MIKLEDLVVGESVVESVNGYGERMVLSVCGLVVTVSSSGLFNEYGYAMTFDELNAGYTLKAHKSLADLYPKDTPMLVSDRDIDGEHIRYSAGWVDLSGRLRCYDNGRTSLTTIDTSGWKYVRPYSS